jgi:hypothetical protein
MPSKDGPMPAYVRGTYSRARRTIRRSTGNQILCRDNVPVSIGQFFPGTVILDSGKSCYRGTDGVRHMISNPALALSRSRPILHRSVKPASPHRLTARGDACQELQTCPSCSSEFQCRSMASSLVRAKASIIQSALAASSTPVGISAASVARHAWSRRRCRQRE